MGFSDYQFAEKERERERKKQLHPVWRGVGCLIVVVLAAAGYLAGGWFLQANASNKWIYLPRELLTPSFLPAWVPSGLIVQLVLAFLFMIFSYGLVSIVYAAIFPKQLGETDSPPLKRRRQTQWRSRKR